MTEHNSEVTEGEQIAEELEAAIQESIDSWTENNGSTAYRQGEFITIREEELVKKLLIMNTATLIGFSEY